LHTKIGLKPPIGVISIKMAVIQLLNKKTPCSLGRRKNCIPFSIIIHFVLYISLIIMVFRSNVRGKMVNLVKLWIPTVSQGILFQVSNINVVGFNAIKFQFFPHFCFFSLIKFINNNLIITLPSLL